MVRMKYTPPNASLGMSFTVERINDQPLLLGEGPHWDADKQLLYYVDITKGTIYCYNPECKTVSKAVVCEGE